jgi:MFS transporter, DHA1 family, multidrug resistance protein
MKPALSGSRLVLMLGLLTMLGPLSIDMYLPGLTAIGADLHVPTAAVELTLATFFAGLALGQLGSGPLLDAFGRRAPVLLGLGLFVVGSLACGFARSLPLLATARFFQALGGSVALIVPRTIVRDLHVGAPAAVMMSKLMLVMGVAPILAPLLGGLLLTAFGWRSIFFFVATMATAALIMCASFLRDTRPEGSLPEPFARSLHALFTERGYVAYLLTGAFAQAGLFAYITGSPFVLVTLHHVPAARFGFYFGFNAFGLIAASQLNRALVQRFSPRAILGVALSLACFAGLVGLVVARDPHATLFAQLAPLFFFLAALGCIFPNATILALEKHGPRAGVASAVFGSGQFTISALVSTLVSRAHDDSAVPMALAMAVASVLACVAWALAVPRRVSAEPSVATS